MLKLVSVVIATFLSGMHGAYVIDPQMSKQILSTKSVGVILSPKQRGFFDRMN